MKPLTQAMFDLLSSKFKTPIVSNTSKYSLVVNNLRVKEIDNLNTQLQDKFVKHGGTLADQIVATAKVYDDKHKVISEAKDVTLIKVPVKTQRRSYIVQGNERSIKKQPRLKQAPFVKRKATKDNLIECHINAAGGGYRIVFDTETLIFKLKVKTHHHNLYAILKDLGVSDDKIRSEWTEAIWKANVKKYKGGELNALYADLRPYAEKVDNPVAEVKSFFESKKLDKRTTQLTLGTEYSNITPELMLECSSKVIKVADGKVKEDDTEDLAYKNLFDEADILPEMTEKNWPAIERALRKELDRKQDPTKILTEKYFTKPIQAFFSTNELSGVVEAFNPLSIMRNDNQMTIMGEGGLGSTYAVEDKMRAVHPSYMGVVDPSATPEGQKIGITNHLSLGAKKMGTEFGMMVFDAKTGKRVDKTKAELADKVIGFFNEFDINIAKPSKPKAKKPKVTAIKPGGKWELVDPKEIEFIYPPHQYFFDIIGNAIPFMNDNDPNRVLMGTKHISQAVALKDADRPMVQAKFMGEQGFSDIMGKTLNNAKISGRVTSIKDGIIKIKGPAGNVDHHYHVKYPLSGSCFYDETPIVAVGDTVKQGQQLTKSPFNKDGTSLTLGKNLSVAYIPYKGYNFEDGIVISETAAKKLTSIHKHEEELVLGPNVKYGPKALAFYFPALMDKVELKKFDANGLPKKGTIFTFGELFLPAVVLSELTPDMSYDRLAKKKGNKPTDVSLKWTVPVPGTVVDAVKSGKMIRIYLETEEPMYEGDKLSHNGGGKGICYDSETEVLTSNGWKFFKDVDTDIDKVPTLNPDTFNIEYLAPTHKICLNYAGPMWHVGKKKLDLCVTPDHNCFIKKEWWNSYAFVPAKDLVGLDVTMPVTGNWVGEEVGHVCLPMPPLKLYASKTPRKDIQITGDLWFEFMGWWLSDGSLNYNDKTNKYVVTISQSLTAKPYNVEKIKKLLDQLPFSWNYTGGIQFNITSKHLTHFLLPLHSKNKRIPRYILNATKRQLNIFLDAYLAGDGYTGHTKTGDFTCAITIFKGLADDLQEVALKLGMAAAIRVRYRSIYRQGYCYDVRFWRKTKHVHTPQGGDYNKLINYAGLVYCLAMPKNHTLYVRRNGLPVWSGNCTKILADNEMPHKADGSPFDVLYNPASIINRVNLSQMFEAMASKIAKKTGQVYLSDNFSGESSIDKIMKEAKKHGIDPSGQEQITIPGDNVTYPAFTGDLHFYKLTHLVRKKMHARGAGAGESYTLEEQPARGHHASGQAAGALELFSMLAGGSRHFLSDISTILSQRNDDFWIAYQKGAPLPSPQVPYVTTKLVNYMKAAGINVERNGSGFITTPLTDANVLKMSSGEIKNPRAVNDKLQPEKGGLFDQEITGGFGANKWNHIELVERIPNPLAQEALVSILGLTDKTFTSLMDGKLFLDTATKTLSTKDTGVTQGKAVETLLRGITVDDTIKNATEEIKNTNGANRDKLIKKLRYFLGAKDANKSLIDLYMMKFVPVLPTKFRQVYPNTSGQVTVTDPVAGYRDVIMMNNQIKDLNDMGLDEKYKREFTGSLYKSVAGLIGTEDMLTPNSPYRGLIRVIKGKMNKVGLFQGRVVARRRDLSARSTIIVDPHLGIDEVGIPKRMAAKIYGPDVVRQLNQKYGLSLIDAKNLVEDLGEEKDSKSMAGTKSEEVLLKALEDITNTVPLYLSRAPALHKYGTIALKPRVIKDGLAIHMNPIIVNGLGADFDGDHVVVTRVLVKFEDRFGLILLDLYDKLDDSVKDMILFLINANLDSKILHEDLKRKDFTMKIKEQLLTRFTQKDTGYTLLSIPIEEFPRESAPIKISGSVRTYKVPEGIQVMAIDAKGNTSWEAVTEFTVSEDLDLHHVIYQKHGLAYASKDKTILVCNKDSYNLEYIKTAEAVGNLTPYLVDMPLCSAIPSDSLLHSFDLKHYREEHGRLTERGVDLYQDSVPCDKDLGYLLGVVVGDGACSDSSPYMVTIANSSAELVQDVDRILNRYFPAKHKSYAQPHEFDNCSCYSEKHQWGCRAFSAFLRDQVGTSSKIKRIPNWCFTTTDDFRFGLLSGLIDTDGSLSQAASGRFGVSYHSENRYLIEDVKLLLKMFGVYASITPYIKQLHDAPKTYYMLVISSYDFVQKLRGKVTFNLLKKQKAWQALQDKDWGDTDKNAVMAREDTIPMSIGLARAFSKRIGSKREAPAYEKNLYQVVHKALKHGSVSRVAAKKLIKDFPVEHEHFDTFKKFTEDETLRWDRVESVTVSGKETMYDITVPGPNTFMAADGLFYWDSVSVSVPISHEARSEALNKMLPSKMLFDAKRNYGEAIINAPSKEYLLGIYLMTKPVIMGKKEERISKEADLLVKFTSGDIKINQAVKLGSSTVCAGQKLYKDVFPKGMIVPLEATNAKKVESHIMKVAKDFPNEVASVIDKIKDLGAYYVTNIGYSISMNDLVAPTGARDKIMSDAAKNVDKMGFEGAYTEASDKLMKLLGTMTDNNFVLSSMESGAFGRPDQVKRMLFTPVAVIDHEDKTVEVPILKSFAEGYTMPEYWLHIPGARAGLAKRGLATADTGAFGKTILAAVGGLTITMDDCHTKKGKKLPVTSNDVLDRVLVDTRYKGQVVTGDLQKKLISSGVKQVEVRSPLYCEAQEGICKQCFGILENGKFPDKGYPIGALAGTTAAERLTQLTLKAFHSGGAMGTANIGWKNIANILSTPKTIGNKAILAELSGKVEKVEEQVGGWVIIVEGIKHFIAKSLELANNIEVGTVVTAGQQLSKYGQVHPKELLDTTGDIELVRDKMMDDIQAIYRLAGVKMKNKIMETLLVPLTKQVEILDASPSTNVKHGLYPGALIDANKALAIQKDDPRMSFKPVLMGLKEAAHETGDVISELMSDELHNTLANAPFIRKRMPISGHPISEFVWGSIGNDPEDKASAENLLRKLESTFGMVSTVSGGFFS